MNQLSFLDGQDLTAPIIARARRDNPATSHEAAAKVEASGKATSHRNILANFVREHQCRRDMVLMAASKEMLEVCLCLRNAAIPDDDVTLTVLVDMANAALTKAGVKGGR